MKRYLIFVLIVPAAILGASKHFAGSLYRGRISTGEPVSLRFNATETGREHAFLQIAAGPQPAPGASGQAGTTRTGVPCTADMVGFKLPDGTCLQIGTVQGNGTISYKSTQAQATTGPVVNGMAVTRQQIVANVTVKDVTHCKATLFTDPGMTQKLEDTNESLFPGAEDCNRPGNAVYGTTVLLVLGARTAQKGVDNVVHSRSAALASDYWLRVTDTTTGLTTSTKVSTQNMPFGDTHIELPAFAAAAWNRWAYPQLDWTGTGSGCGVLSDCIDNLSGVTFRLVSMNLKGEGGAGDNFRKEMQFSGVLPAAGWQNADNMWQGIPLTEGLCGSASNSSPGSYATYAGTSRDPIYIPFNRPGCYYSWAMDPWQVDGQQVSDVALNLYGNAAGASGDDSIVQVAMCLHTKDNCTPEISTPLPGNPGRVQVPQEFPKFQFAGWHFDHALTSEEAGIPNGKASVTGNAVTLQTGSLPPDAKPGWMVYINDRPATIGTISTATQFWTVEDLGAGSGTWRLVTLMARIRKKTSTPNAINLAATWSLVWNTNTSAGPGGPDCNPATFDLTTDATGTPYPGGASKKARLCNVRGYLIVLADDGESRFLSELARPQVKDSAGQPMIPPSPWLPGDPYSFSAVYWDDTGTYGGPGTAMQSLYKGTYNFADPGCQWRQKLIPNNGYEHQDDDPCIVWTNLTPYTTHSTLTEQIQNVVHNSPVWDDTQMGSTFIANYANIKTSGDYMMMNIESNGQNSPCFDAVFQMSTGNLMKFFDTLTGMLPGLTYFGCHSYGLALATGTKYGSIDGSILPHSPQNPSGWLSGPFVLPTPTAKSFDGQTWTTDITLSPGTLIPYPDARCGSNPVRPVGQYVFAAGISYNLDGSQCVDQTNVAGACPAGFGLDGLMQCVWFEIDDDHPCNVSATSYEATKWPCPWGGHTSWSNPAGQQLQAGDMMSWLQTLDGIDGKHGTLKVLSDTPSTRTPGKRQILLQRFAQNDNLYSNPQAPTSPAVLWYDHLFNGPIGNTHPQVWIPWMKWSSNGFMDLSVPLANTVVQPDFITTHSAVGLGPDGTQYTSVGYGETRTCLWPDCIGSPSQYHLNIETDTFGGVTRSSSAGMVEQYPNVTNWTAASAEQRSMYHDFRHINPDLGTTAENPVKVWPHTYTFITGQLFTYRMDIWQDLGIRNYKTRPPNVFSSRGAFYDVSGPGSTIDDSKPWAYCYAYKDGECVKTSSAGQLFVVAPNANIGFGGCTVNTNQFYTPCATPLWNFAGWMVQGDTQHDDPLGTRIRRITMGLSGPAAQYEYLSPFMTPDTNMALVKANYAGGVRPDYLAIKMPPPPPPDDGIDRTNFIDTPVDAPAGLPLARARFGYAENGRPDQFYCTSRREACVTDTQVMPFAFAQTDTVSGQACAGGCTIHIPAISGRVVYYRVERSTDGVTWVSGDMSVIAIP